MNVRELIEQLQALPQDAIVVMASDPEGNSFDTFSGDVGTGFWKEDDRYDDQFHTKIEVLPEGIEDEYDLEEYDPDTLYINADEEASYKPAIVLWP